MRRLAALAALAALVAPTPARAAEGVTLAVQPIVRYDGLARFHGSAGMLADVFLVQRLPPGWTVVAQTRAGTDGSFAFEPRMRAPGVFQARTLAASSVEVAVRIRPRLHARVEASFVRGRLLPAKAGTALVRGRRIRIRPN